MHTYKPESRPIEAAIVTTLSQQPLATRAATPAAQSVGQAGGESMALQDRGRSWPTQSSLAAKAAAGQGANEGAVQAVRGGVSAGMEGVVRGLGCSGVWRRRRWRGTGIRTPGTLEPANPILEHASKVRKQASKSGSRGRRSASPGCSPWAVSSSRDPRRSAALISIVANRCPRLGGAATAVGESARGCCNPRVQVDSEEASVHLKRV